jgi:hypothetical protein
MVPEIRPLTSDEAKALEQGLELAALLAKAIRPLRSDQLEALYNSIYGSDSRDPLHIIALGLGFGEELMTHGEFDWVRVTDDFGEETCIAMRGFCAYCAPISMIQKRLGRGELPDFVGLREATIAALEDQITLKTEERDF